MRFGVVIERDEQLAFRHDIIRDAVRASVPASARRALDRQAADVLLAAGATPVEVATQLAASAEPGDELAITTLFKAAEAVAMSDPGAAADLSRRALELAPRRHPLRGPLVAQTALLLHEAARVEEARAFADTSLRRGASIRAGGRGPAQHRGDVRGFARRACRRRPEGARAARSPARPARATSRVPGSQSHGRGPLGGGARESGGGEGGGQAAAVMRTPHSCSISPRADWRLSPDDSHARSS